METVKVYITGILYVSLIIGILSSLPIHSKSLSAILKFVSAIALTIAVLGPIIQFKLPKLSSFDQYFSSEKELIIGQAAETAAQEERRIINDLISAYILDKASSLGANLEVTVSLGKDYPYRPERIQLLGLVSPYARSVLSEYIETNLGVTEEEQVWISEIGPKS